MQQKEDVENNGEDERQSRDNPDNKGEQHGSVNDGLLPVSGFGHGFDVHEELHEGGAVLRGRMVSYWDKLSFHHSPQCKGIDDDSRSLSNDDDQGACQS